jgi:Flp pilus assembly protein CpaB
MILLAVAVVCGLAAALAAAQFLKIRGSSGAERTKEVWVAKADIKENTLIEKPEDLFERKTMTEERSKYALAAGNPADLKGKYVTRSLAKEQFVTPKDIEKNMPVITPPPGKTYVGLNVSAEKIVGGFVHSDSHVDVIWTGDDPNPRRSGGRLAQIKLQNLLVLAVDHNTQPPPEGTKGPSVASVTTVTLAVTYDEAKKLQQLKDGNNLRLVLRGPEDGELASTKGAISAQDPDWGGEEASAPSSVDVPVARDYLPANTRLDYDKHFVLRKFPERPRDALTIEEIRAGDKVLKQPVSAGEFVSKRVDVGDGKEVRPPVEGPHPEPGKKVPEMEKPRPPITIIEGGKVRTDS